MCQVIQIFISARPRYWETKAGHENGKLIFNLCIQTFSIEKPQPSLDMPCKFHHKRFCRFFTIEKKCRTLYDVSYMVSTINVAVAYNLVKVFLVLPEEYLQMVLRYLHVIKDNSKDVFDRGEEVESTWKP